MTTSSTVNRSRFPLVALAAAIVWLAAACDGRDLLSPRPQFSTASTVTVSGTVAASGSPLAGATIEAIASGIVQGTATTDAIGGYSLAIEAGTYDFRVTPPSGSGFQASTLLGRTISSNTQLDFVLVPAGTATLNGRLLDGLGDPVANQSISLVPASGGSAQHASTASDGSYQFDVAAGNYMLQIFDSGIGAPTGALPGGWALNSSEPIPVSGAVIFDIALPLHRIDVEVRNAAGDAIENVQLRAGGPPGSAPLQINGLAFSGMSTYDMMDGPLTDAAGHATLWLFPNSSFMPYVITADPPVELQYATTQVADVQVTGDMLLAITLAEQVVLSGRVLDALGEPLANQFVSLAPYNGGSTLHASTDADGAYSFSIAAGSYRMQLFGSSGIGLPLGARPGSYHLNSQDPIVVAADMTFDVRLPAHRVDVSVADESAAPVAGVLLTVGGPPGSAPLSINGIAFSGNSSYSTTDGPVTDDAGNAVLWLFPSPSFGSYIVTADPPDDLPFAVTGVSVHVAGDRALDIVLAPQVILSGRLLDALGAPLAHQTISVTPDGGGAMQQATTGVDGGYQFSVAAASYNFQVMGTSGIGAPTGARPGSYHLNSLQAIEVSGDVEFDIRLPLHRVDVTVQDASGAGVADVQLRVGGPPGSATLIVNGLPFSGMSNYSSMDGPHTDAQGNATLWLFPNPDFSAYVITADPPDELPFAVTDIAGVTVDGDVSKIIILQFNHAPPVTTASIAPAPTGSSYADPATVALTATAAPGYTVAQTFLAVDDGAPTIYSAHVTVSGAGEHTIEFWSVDDSGVTEQAQRITFSLRGADDTPPVIEPVVTGLLGDNGWYRSDVRLEWQVSDPESVVNATGCEPVDLTADTDAREFTCSATSAGGSNAVDISLQRDATPPSLAFAPEQPVYAVDDRITIACIASDELSDIAQASCPEMDADAWTRLGHNVLTAEATDNAGNFATRTTEFDVVATHDAVCALVQRFVSAPGVRTSLCQKLSAARAAQERGNARAAANMIAAFANEVEAQRGKTLSSEHADALLMLAEALR